MSSHGRRSSFPRSFDQRLGQIPQRAAPRGRGGGHNRFHWNAYDRGAARVRGEIRTKSVNVRGTVEGNIFVTERCELHANCTVRGDIEAPRLVVSENATFLGSAKVGGREVTHGLTWRAGRGQHCNRLREVLQPLTRWAGQHLMPQTASNEYTAAIDETLVSLTGFC